ncbi:MAG: tetratricopeptide repeat protein [Candidatus Thorarchaeota archaeon]|nr:MAG: tetratricopeptide repeat protein [Candidatus Thorarchaeota archaeon]
MTEELDAELDELDPAELLEEAAAELEAGDKDEAAKKFNAVGNIYMSVAEFEEAHKCFEEAQKIYKELKDETGICDTMYNLGVASINLERWDEALTSLESAMKLFDKAANASGSADAVYGLALASLGQGSFDEAMDYFKKAQKAYKSLDNIQGIASVIMDMGAAHVDKEDWVSAKATIKKALTMYEEMGDKAGMADAQSLLGDISETNGDEKRAAEMFVDAASNYFEAGIFDISREVLDRAEQKMWDVPKATRRRLRKVIDDLRDNLPEEDEIPDDDLDDDEDIEDLLD